jgi:hypothetical protein
MNDESNMLIPVLGVAVPLALIVGIVWAIVRRFRRPS